ncbi:unnamed protein product [Hyaloperonospora brassicae]|uniref:HSF-type DNA-binding domain-containing protein n=1 Tax=Hyaloperonospora brassicae TaxID=162125 RepID=A0AAV0T068_HYABA|nr:unnamed protein product [Hyaloperonospora brassicae]
MVRLLTLELALSRVSTNPPMDVKHLLSSETPLECHTSPTTSAFSVSSTCVTSSPNEANRGWVAPFLLHLHQMLRREDSAIVRWAADGLAFQILDKQAMTSLVLPKYFKNKNFSSFQRQLNYFGFRKWSKARAPFPTYSREYFTRDNYNQMALVKRQSKKFRQRRVAAGTPVPATCRAGVQSTAASASDRCHALLPHTRADPATAVTWMSQSRVMSPTMAPAFVLPVLSPTRKMNSSSKLPSIRDLPLSRAMSHAGTGLTRPRLLA